MRGKSERSEENYLGLVRPCLERRDDLLAVLLVHGEGLLGQNVEPGADRLDGDGCVVVVRRRDNDPARRDERSSGG